jgi:hypothetical protein
LFLDFQFFRHKPEGFMAEKHLTNETLCVSCVSNFSDAPHPTG